MDGLGVNDVSAIFQLFNDSNPPDTLSSLSCLWRAGPRALRTSNNFNVFGLTRSRLEHVETQSTDPCVDVLPSVLRVLGMHT